MAATEDYLVVLLINSWAHSIASLYFFYRYSLTALVITGVSLSLAIWATVSNSALHLRCKLSQTNT
jgi:hypothetical protein